MEIFLVVFLKCMWDIFADGWPVGLIFAYTRARHYVLYNWACLQVPLQSSSKIGMHGPLENFPLYWGCWFSLIGTPHCWKFTYITPSLLKGKWCGYDDDWQAAAGKWDSTALRFYSLLFRHATCWPLSSHNLQGYLPKDGTSWQAAAERWDILTALW